MSHWYTISGAARHKTIGSNGKERPTTVRDAKKHGYIPSVTTIIDILAKPALTFWKVEQAIISATKNQMYENESEREYIDRIVEDSLSGSREASDFGSYVHSYIESLVTQKTFSIDESRDNNDILEKASYYISNNKFIGNGEQIIVTDKYAGTIDFIGTWNDKKFIIDFKTQNTKRDKPIKLYDEWLYQLMAYKNAVKYAIKDDEYDVANIVISSTEPGRIQPVMYDKKEQAKALRVFNNLVKIFYDIKGL